MILYIKLIIFSINLIAISFNNEITYLVTQNEVIYSCILNYFLLIAIDSIRSKYISPYLLFQIPFGLFILGRFIGWVLNEDLNINLINYYYEIDLTDSTVRYYLLLSMLFYNSCSLGYELFRGKNKKNSIETVSSLNSKIVTLFIFLSISIFTPLIFVDIYKTLNLVQESGYAAMYINKKENVGNFLSMGMNVISICLGLSMLDDRYKKQRALLMLILFLTCLSLFIMGSRGPIMTFMLLYFWVYMRNKSIIKILIYGITILLMIQLLNSYVRTVQPNDKILAKFIFDQGTTFIILPLLDYINEWPTLGLLQNFIPGISRFLSLFYDYPAYEANLANYMGYKLNSDLYASGNGLGWTIIADIYIYSGSFIPLFVLFSILWGGGLSLLTNSIKHNRFSLSLITSITLQLSFLYRSGLFSIVPLVIYFLIIYFLLYFISVHLKNRKNPID